MDNQQVLLVESGNVKYAAVFHPPVSVTAYPWPAPLTDRPLVMSRPWGFWEWTGVVEYPDKALGFLHGEIFHLTSAAEVEQFLRAYRP